MARRLAAEALGTALLLIAVIGSAILGDQLANGNVAIAALVTTIATGTMLGAVIQSFRVVSGAHINPVVTLVEVLRSRISRGEAAAYASVQIIGALAGVAAVYALCAFSALAVPHVITPEALVSASGHARSGGAQLLGEFVATFGLIGVVIGCSRTRTAALPVAVGAYVAAVYWFTASASFANPAVTLTQAVLNTIPPLTALAFIVAQLFGGAASAALFSWLLRVSSAETGLRRERKDWP
jgi:glycerol uptake facilitator-like aquaporin